MAIAHNLKVIHTQKENGVMTVVDKFGNGATIYVVPKTGNTASYSDIVRKPYKVNVLPDGGILIFKEKTTKINPFTLFFYYEGEKRVAYAFLYTSTKIETHEVFRNIIMHIARNKAQGGCNETAWFNCWGAFFGTYLW